MSAGSASGPITLNEVTARCVIRQDLSSVLHRQFTNSKLMRVKASMGTHEGHGAQPHLVYQPKYPPDPVL